MMRNLNIPLACVLICVPALGSGTVPLAPGSEDPGYVLVIHTDNATASLSRERVAALFLLAEQVWEDGLPVEPVGQPPESEAHGAFSHDVHGRSSAAVQRDWLKADVAARTVVRLNDDAAVLEWVRHHPGAIGYVSAGAFLGPGVKTVAVTPSAEEADDEDQGAGDQPSRVSMVLDASGSMRMAIDGHSKLAIATAAVREILEEWDPAIALGLVVYGHHPKGAPGEACKDIQILVPVDRGGADAVGAALDGIEARGATPMTDAVIAAAKDAAKPGEEARVVLISDGEETCGKDPCRLNRVIEETGVGLAAYVVGFDILRNTRAQSQLRCLADETGGSFQLAWDAKSLRKALRATVARATGRPLLEEAPPQPAAGVEDADGLDLRLQHIAAGEIAAIEPPRRRVRADEPRRQIVRVDHDYWITDTEITQGDWRRLMGGNPSHFRDGGDLHPVERVNFFDVLLFANRLSQREGLTPCYRLEACRGVAGSGCGGEGSCDGDFFCSGVTPLHDACDGYRLPTRTEWRYAAQGDRETVFWWGDELSPEDANCARNSRDGIPGTSEARAMPANPFGLFGMHGNVAEWLLDADRGRRVYASEDEIQESKAARAAARRISSNQLRRSEQAAGGGWRSQVSACYASGVEGLHIEQRSDEVGFRLVRRAAP